MSYISYKNTIWSDLRRNNYTHTFITTHETRIKCSLPIISLQYSNYNLTIIPSISYNPL